MNANRLNFWSVTAAAAVLACGVAAALSATEARAQTAQTTAAKNKLVIQVSDADPRKWGLALNNARNVQQDLGKDQVEIEIVAYGPGIGMLKMDSEVGTRVSEALGDGVKLVACENTMTNQKLTRDDMLPRIGYAKAGVVEIMQKQQQGYAYIRP
jgi:intracellular sulfur oxidation DsrE/DsrF family protein